MSDAAQALKRLRSGQIDLSAFYDRPTAQTLAGLLEATHVRLHLPIPADELQPFEARFTDGTSLFTSFRVPGMTVGKYPGTIHDEPLP